MKKTDVTLGIILKSDRHKEFDTRLSVLTPDGLRTFYSIGSQKPSSKLKSSIGLFNIAEFTVIGTKIINVNILQLSLPISKDINRYYLACSISQVLLQIYKANQSDDTNPNVFTLTARCFEYLSTTGVSCYKIFIYFYTNLLILLGYDIDIPEFKNQDSTSPKFFDLDYIKIDLPTAKNHIKQLINSYIENLDIIIQHTEIF